MDRWWSGEATIILTGLNIPIMKTRQSAQNRTLQRLMRKILSISGTLQNPRRSQASSDYSLGRSEGSDVFCSIMLPQVRHLNNGRFLSPSLNSTKSQSSRLSLCFGFECVIQPSRSAQYSHCLFLARRGQRQRGLRGDWPPWTYRQDTTRSLSLDC